MKNAINSILLFSVLISFVSCASQGAGCYDFGSADDSKAVYEQSILDITGVNGKAIDSKEIICE